MTLIIHLVITIKKGTRQVMKMFSEMTFPLKEMEKVMGVEGRRSSLSKRRISVSSIDHRRVSS
jgi:hypothetical protein